LQPPHLAQLGRLTLQQKRILAIMLNGDPKPGLLMHIIRFVMPSKSKPLKKLMYFFFEVCPKHDAQGKLRQEWILVWCVKTRALHKECC
jgi:vesicle coat complex subunit